MPTEKIILASTSKFRRDLLATTGLDFSCCRPNIDESAIEHPDPKQLATKRAEAKARAASLDNPEALVLGCDQVLEFCGRAFGKASNRDEAFARLGEFAGKEHKLLSSYAFYINGQRLTGETVTVTMSMRSLSNEEIESYLNTGEWVGCAGCYQYENRGGLLFNQTDSNCDFSAIVGLPIRHINAALLNLGINILTNPSGPWTLIQNH